MAREVITRVFCDIHQDRDGAKIDATFRGTEENPYANVIVIDGQRRAIDLCTECQAIIDQLRDLLTEYGYPAETLDPPKLTRPPSKTSGHHPCRACEAVYKHGNSLRDHERKVHGMHKQNGVGRYVCDVPGCTDGPNGTAFAAEAPQGLGAHKRYAHNVQGSSKSTLASRALEQ